MYANVHLDEDSGHIEVKSTTDDLRAWARRPGASWPCSTLARCDAGIQIVLDIATGDLLDIVPLLPLLSSSSTRDDYEDIAGNELTAFLDDALTDAGAALLAARRVRTA